MSREYPNDFIGQLSAKDFDGTFAQTFEPAPNGLTVGLAYDRAVAQVLGGSALEIFQAQELCNRAPGEIVADLAPHLDDTVRRQRTEDLVEAKLDLLYDQVGQRLPDGSLWPRMTVGFKRLYLAEHLEPGIDTAVVSSGHEKFISRFFEVHELPEPDVIVTDDDMRPLAEHLPPELCVKPGRLILDLAHHRWLEKLGLAKTYDNVARTRDRIVYSGDDVAKDGQLAANAGVRFVHINPANPQAGWDELLNELAVNYESLRKAS